MAYQNEGWLLASKPVADKVFKILADIALTSGSQFDYIKVSPSGNTYLFHAYTWWNDLDDKEDDWDMFDENSDILEGELYNDGCDDEEFDLWNEVDRDGTIHEVDKGQLCKAKWEEFQKAIKAYGMKTILPLDKVIAPIKK